MRVMGVDLLVGTTGDPEAVAEGRASVWLAGDAVVRACFHDAADALVTHGLELLIAPDEVGAAERRLLLISSREADVHTFAGRLRGEGWREVARSHPGRSAGTGYFLALVDHPSRA